MLKPSHFKTPRQRLDCYEDSRLDTDSTDTVLHWIAALGIGAFIGILIGMGI